MSNRAVFTAKMVVMKRPLDYLFGPPTPAALYSTDPPPSHPAFVVVHEAIGYIADIGDVQLDRGSYSGSGGSGYDAWDLTANIPGHPLYLHITSNQGTATLIRIAAAVVGRTIRCGAVSGGQVQTRRCAYAAAGVSAPSSVDGPLLFTGRAPGEPGVTLFAAQPMQAPRALVRQLPDNTIVAPSPRGRYIALAERERGLWLVNSDGSGLHRLLSPPPPRPGPTGGYYIGAVAWSPDRYTIAYAIVQPLGYPLYPPAPRGKPDGIWLVRYDGGPPRQLATNAQLGVDGAGRLSFSSDGRTLAAVAYSGRAGYNVAIDVATGRVESLLGTVVNVDDVQFSPTSAMLAYLAAELAPIAGSPHDYVAEDVLSVADAQGKHRTALVHSTLSTSFRNVAWAPDGRGVAYLRIAPPGTNAVDEIRSVDVATGRVRTLIIATPRQQLMSLVWMASQS